jgi:outer membrane cobalamin receptor
MKSKLFTLFFLLCTFRTVAQVIQPGSLLPENNGFSDRKVAEDPKQDTIVVREVEVTAKRKPEETGLHISKPDSLAIHSGLTIDLSDLLSHYTPVFIKSYGRGGQATAHFRGTSASHTQIIWNGMNLNSPMRGYTDLSQLPLFFIDDIYLLHGGSSLSAGSGALGGSIHLENRPDWKTRKSVSGVIEQGSFHTGRYMTRIQTGSAKFQSVSRLYYERSQNDFPFYNAGVIPHRQDTLKNGDYGRKAVLQEFYYRTPDDLTVTVRGWYQTNNRNLPPLMSWEGSQRQEYQKDDQMRIQFELKKYGASLNYTFNSGFNWSEMKYFLKIPDNNYIVRDAASMEQIQYNQFKFNYLKGPKFSCSGSFEAVFSKVETREKVNNEGYNKERQEAGLLLHLQYRPGERTGLYLLSRSAYWDRKIIPLIPSAGMEWQISGFRPLYLKMNITRNYHKPGLNDLYWIPGGNPELLPEQGTTAELIFSSAWKKNDFSLSQELSGYGSEIQNWIIWQPSANGAWYWEAANLEKVIGRGVEYDFSASLKFHQWKMNLSGNYAFTRTWQPGSAESADPSRKKQLIYIPKHAANMHLAVTRGSWSILGDIAYTGKRYTENSSQSSYYENILNPFWLTCISLQKQISVKKLEIGIKFKTENLFNIRYQQILWRPMPERNYSITLVAGFKNE